MELKLYLTDGETNDGKKSRMLRFVVKDYGKGIESAVLFASPEPSETKQGLLELDANLATTKKSKAWKAYEKEMDQLTLF